MHFSSVLFLAASVLASPLVSRDVNSIVAGINGIEAKVTSFNNTLNQLNGNPLTSVQTVLNIEEANAELQNAVTAATKAVKASQPLDETDSGTVAVAVLNFAPQISSLLNNLVAHKYQFDHAILGTGSVSPQVENDLKNEQSLAQTFANDLIPLLTPDYQSLAPLATGPIFSAFANAIKVFSKSGGTFALPAVNGLGELELELKKYLP